MYRLIRNILFLLDAETAHHLGLKLLNLSYKLLPNKLFKQLLSVHTNTQNIQTKNNTTIHENFFSSFKIGLAAGLDKNAEYFEPLAACGFDFIEIGTVTPQPQPGNPKPRLFRLIKDQAIINRMGFNNDGADAIKKRLQNKPSHIIVGVNIGKNKNTPNDKAVNDYLYCYKTLYDVADYFIVNVSSPNTPNLRELQEKHALINIFTALQNEEKQLSTSSHKKPVFLKIAPDLTDEQLKDIAEVILQTNITGVIATNTTISRDNLQYEQHPEKYGNGGLSGKPLFEKSLDIVRKLRLILPPNKIIIGVGGIDSPQKAQLMKDAGANAIQIYTAFIYHGPKIISGIKKQIN
ncbi:MAG: dihydroorotate dehydrogenase (quinone) [Bacteroidia bacterium]|nr:MAG: dihydroorotate dehydrogenase (quinone) [Bacteroidia bacterium]